MSQKTIDAFLKKYYPIGSKVELWHPNGFCQEAATIISFTRSEMQGSYANGVMVQFDDGVYIDVPYYHLDCEDLL